MYKETIIEVKGKNLQQKKKIIIRKMLELIQAEEWMMNVKNV